MISTSKLSLVLAGSLIAVVLLPSLTDVADAVQPYVAGYPVSSVYYKVDKIWMFTHYKWTDQFQLNCLIQDELSAAGGTGIDRTGWIYQAKSFMYGSASPVCASSSLQGKVMADPEVWKGGTLKWWVTPTNVGSHTSIDYIKQRADWQNAKSQVQFAFEVRYTSGSTTIYGFTYNKTDYNDPSSYFMVGSTTYNGYNVRFFQFGVESYGQDAYPAGWKIRQYDAGFYDSVSGTNKYLSNMSAKAVQGQYAYITWQTGASVPDKVGGQQFKYTDKTSSTGIVDWFYNAFNTNGVPNDATLW
ncbi:MAG: hypothetical protein QXU32_11855 [Nitrososphaerales archaeon]